MNEIFTHCIPLPKGVKGCVVEKPDTGDYIVFVNENLCYESRDGAFKHEVDHILEDHFRDTIDVRQAEWEADGLIST